MTHYEHKANELRAEADKKLTTKGFLEVLFGSAVTRTEHAISDLQKAGNFYKMAHNWSKAGTAFLDSADLNLTINDVHSAINAYIDAAFCYKKCDVQKSIVVYLKAIGLATDSGKFGIAARYHQQVGEIMEETLDFQNSILHYEQAADFYRTDESHSAANKCLAKVAEFSALLEHYAKAIDLFEQIGCYHMNNALLHYSAREYFFRAAICHLCNQCTYFPKVIEHYVRLYPGFDETREYNLLVFVDNCLNNNDIDTFTQAMREYDLVTRFSDWHSTMLLRIKKRMTGTPDIR